MRDSKSVSVTTANSLEGYEIDEYLGVVRGIVDHYQATGRLSRRLAA